MHITHIYWITQSIDEALQNRHFGCLRLKELVLGYNMYLMISIKWLNLIVRANSKHTYNIIHKLGKFNKEKYNPSHRVFMLNILVKYNSMYTREHIHASSAIPWIHFTNMVVELIILQVFGNQFISSGMALRYMEMEKIFV